MTSRITVSYKVFDARAEVKVRRFQALGLEGVVKATSIFDCYTIDAELSPKELELVGKSLTNPLLETFSINDIVVSKDFDYLIEVGCLPGVTDNVGNTTKETIADLLKWKFGLEESVYSSQVFFMSGTLSKQDVQKIALSLYNPLIQRALIKKVGKNKLDLPMVVPKVVLESRGEVSKVNLNVSDEELTKIGKYGIYNSDGTSRGPLALDLVSMKAIKKYFQTKRRPPTDIEMESIAQTWSEHCKHTIFANPIDELDEGLYKSYIKEATRVIRKKKGKNDFCASVFTDNSGGIIFDENYLVTHKVETHNSPSALDPFGGAITGIVGVNRDAMGFGLGAKPIANIYGFCLGNPDDNRPLYRDKNLTQKMLSPRRIMDGVIQGVNVGGNCSGIPTAQGFVYFNDRFRGKPAVFVGTVGLIPRKIGKNSSTKKKAKPGDYIVMVGGRVGQDGIHGATFSSEVMDAKSPATAVQIGDPITQKKMSDAIIKEARDLCLYNSITDNGAGGISCSVAEMARESNGCQVEIEKVPLKYPGLEPWKIWISESQERMTLAIPKNKWRKFKELMERRGVEATIIGVFTNSGKCLVTHNGSSIMNIELEFLHNGLPKKQLVTDVGLNCLDEIRGAKERECETYSEYVERLSDEGNEEVRQTVKSLNTVMLDLVKRPNIASFEFISSQYDHEVQASSVLKPLQGRGRINGEVAILRPILGSKKGIVLSSALNPSYSEIDSYKMAASSIDGAIRAIVAAGADINYIALLDNFCWCSSNDPIRLGQLKKAVKACYDYAVIYETPFISGKDTMFNDFKGFDKDANPISISVPPTLLISSIGVMKDVTKAISIDFKFAGDLIYLLGDTYDELAGSEYFAYLGENDFGRQDLLTNPKKLQARRCDTTVCNQSLELLDKQGANYNLVSNVPAVDGEKNKKLYQAFGKCTDQELIASAISVGRGGLGIAILKSAMAGKLGADISLKSILSSPHRRGSSTLSILNESPLEKLRDDFILFSESQGRILVTISPSNQKKFEKLLKGNFAMLIGKVSKISKLKIAGLNNKNIVNLDISQALEAYKSRFKGY